MKKTRPAFLSMLFISAVLCWIYLAMMPQWVSEDEGLLSEFSTKRALIHVSNIAAAPHYASAENHKKIAAYLQNELKKIGVETEIQEGLVLSNGVVVKSQNIVARIKGSASTKALLLLSHYDSAPHSYSHGASDDGSGLAVILESLRTFLHNKTPHKNDIIILFSDAEELSLNGAALFVTKHEWAKDIGIALNFEARGTSGPGYMFMEVNHGNAAMVKAFANANPKYPVSNSLMYSIYKMMPNDTDLTVFRENGKIQGFNFAFIDGHFNYHTVQDDYAHLSHETLAHQGSYLVPLLLYFANADLRNLDSAEDFVYFNTPFCFVSYPFNWIFPMLIISFVLFLFLLFIGIGKRTLVIPELAKGFIPLIGALITTGIITFFGWRILLVVYPQYTDILQGFTYNGHSYIAAFVSLSLAVSFLFYIKTNTENLAVNHSVAPLFLWIAINFGIAFLLPGAGFFIIPVFCGLLMLAYFVVTQRTNVLFNLVVSIPILVILVPYIVMFPIGLGLKILAGSAVLTVLVFTLLLPVFGTFFKKGFWSVLFFIIAIGCFIHAHLNSGYELGKAKPNSLLYVYDADNNKAVWTTYDKNLDQWTKVYLSDNPKRADFLNKNMLRSKYNSEFTFSSEALPVKIPEPQIEFLRDTIVGTHRHLKIRISSKRKVNRYDIFANENMVFHNLKANGATELGQKGSKYIRDGRHIISYYVVDNEPLELQFSIPKQTVLDMELLESSFDLMHNRAFHMQQRKPSMMPTPFVLNDAIVIKKKIKPAPKTAVPIVQQKLPFRKATPTDTIADPDAEN